MTTYAVIDTETTGLGKTDRVVEIAVVLVDGERLEVIDEFDTLLNPMRDIGPTDVHGLTPSMVSAAPTFEEVAGGVADRIEGCVLVAHNLRFDERMLALEFDRLGADLEPGRGVCTLALTGDRLSVACERYGIALTHHHRALVDARAAAQLLIRVFDSDDDLVTAHVGGVTAGPTPRTLRRDHLGDGYEPLPLTRLVRTAPFPTTDQAVLSYLDSLDWVLDDLVIDDAERAHLLALATDLGLDIDDVDRAHRDYFRSLVAGAQRDGIITIEERRLLGTVAQLLSLGDVVVPEVSDRRAAVDELPPGTRVCFTGTAVIDGQAVVREDVEATAAVAGLRPVGGVTKQCDLLVCADPTSMSKKAQRARQYGIPIMTFEDFVSLLGYVEMG